MKKSSKNEQTFSFSILAYSVCIFLFAFEDYFQLMSSARPRRRKIKRRASQLLCLQTWIRVGVVKDWAQMTINLSWGNFWPPDETLLQTVSACNPSCEVSILDLGSASLTTVSRVSYSLCYAFVWPLFRPKNACWMNWELEYEKKICSSQFLFTNFSITISLGA
jgi:hypothetical protein